jgi:hypothetical protein
MEKNKEDLAKQRASLDELQGIIDDSRDFRAEDGGQPKPPPEQAAAKPPPAQAAAVQTQHTGKKKKSMSAAALKLAPADKVQYQSPKKVKPGSSKRSAMSAPQSSPARGASYEAVSAEDKTVGGDGNDEAELDGQNLFQYSQDQGGEVRGGTATTFAGENVTVEDVHSDDDDLGYGGEESEGGMSILFFVLIPRVLKEIRRQKAFRWMISCSRVRYSMKKMRMRIMKMRGKTHMKSLPRKGMIMRTMRRNTQTT